MRVLLVEDDASLQSVLTRGLAEEGYAVDCVGSGTEALWRIAEYAYAAVILDLGLPDLGGLEVCRQARAEGRWVPVLILTARDTVDARVEGLDAGADDYLVKPFALDELFARLRVLVRREPTPRPATLVVGDLVLDPARHEVRRGDQRIDLTPKEFALLHHLMRSPDQVHSRASLIDSVWDSAYDGDPHVVNVYINYLRDKIDKPFGRRTVLTVRGAGYCLRAET
jgi:two-component system OmpR family response regulator